MGIAKRAGVFALIWTPVLVLALAILQHVLLPIPRYIGLDATELLVAMMVRCWKAATLELALLLAVQMIWLGPFVWLGRFAWEYFAPNGKAVQLLAVSAPLLAYATFLLGSVVYYPAMYDRYLPEGLKTGAHALGFKVPPGTFTAVAGLIFAAPLLVVGARELRRAHWVIPLAALAIVLGLSSARGSGKQLPRPSRPHILFLAADSFRADRVANPKNLPAIAALKGDRQTTSFDDTMVGVPRTFPSWVEILTGRYSAESGIRHMFPPGKNRIQNEVCLPEVLREQGYRSLVISDAAGDIFPRIEAGFDEVLAPTFDLPITVRESIDQRFPLFMPPMLGSLGHRLFPAMKHLLNFCNPHHLTDRVIDTLGDAGDRPFFITVFYSVAHFPYAAQHPYYRSFGEAAYHGPHRFFQDEIFRLDPEFKLHHDIKQVQALYDGSLRSIDDAMGRLFDYLKESGLWDDTIIMFTADHGEHLYGEPLPPGHGHHLHGENVVRVPWLVKLNRATQPPAKAFGFTTRTIDMAPTVLGLAGASVPKEMRGMDLSPWLRGQRRDDPGLGAYSESGILITTESIGPYSDRLPYPGITSMITLGGAREDEFVLQHKFEKMMVVSRHRSLTRGRYRLTYRPTQHGVRLNLYDRVTDPFNSREIEREQPEVARAMTTELLALIARLEPGSQLVDLFVVPRSPPEIRNTRWQLVIETIEPKRVEVQFGPGTRFAAAASLATEFGPERSTIAGEVKGRVLVELEAWDGQIPKVQIGGEERPMGFTSMRLPLERDLDKLPVEDPREEALLGRPMASQVYLRRVSPEVNELKSMSPEVAAFQRAVHAWGAKYGL